MSSMFEDLEEKAAQLSAEERARLALLLIQSLEPADEGDIDEAWRIEAERRLAEIESDEATLIPAEEVFENVRRKLR